MKTIKEIQEEIVEEFSVFSDWMDKYEYLIELGKNMPLIDEKDKTSDNLIEGCQSRVWLSCREQDGRLHFAADSDAIITKGVISLLLMVYDGQKPEDILASDEEFISRIGLKENLSPTRANGLVSMVKTIKAYAAAHAGGAAPRGAMEEAVIQALRNVYDPEIPVNVYDLGLIYEVQCDADGQVFVKMTLTAPNCPIADDVVASVQEEVSGVEGVTNVQVDLVFEPEWTTDMMSDEAKLELGML